MKQWLLVFFLLSTTYASIKAQVLLYDQTDSVTTSGILCRANDPATTFDVEGADDFIVPTGETWYIDSFKTYGFYNATAPAATPTIVTVYSNNAGLPGTIVFNDTIADGDIDGDGNLEPELDSPLMLTSGHYWVSVRIFTSSVPWYWYRINQQVSPYDFHWQNPGGGYNACNTWEPLSTCLAINDSSVAFRVYGCYGPKPTITDLGPDTTHCGPGLIALQTSSSSSNLVYTWNTGASGNSLNVSNSGYYRVFATDTLTQCAATSDIDVDFANLPDPGLTDILGCQGTNGFFIPSFGNSYDYLWHDGTTGSSFNATSPGTISVTITDNATGCVDADTVTFGYHPFQLDVLPGDSGFLCDGGELTFSTAQSFSSYFWNLNNNTSGDSSGFTVDDIGTLYLTVTDSNNCSNDDTIQINEAPPALPEIEVDVIAPGLAELSTTQPFSSYLWSTGDTTPTTDVTEGGAYNVTVTNDFNCEGTAVKIVSSNLLSVSNIDVAGLKLFPNPAKDFLNIQWPEQWVGESFGRIVDPSGRVIEEFNATGASQRIDLSKISAGSYIVHIMNNDGIATYNIIVQ